MLGFTIRLKAFPKNTIDNLVMNKNLSLTPAYSYGFKCPVFNKNQCIYHSKFGTEWFLMVPSEVREL